MPRSADAVVFGSDGVHYRVGKDGHPDLSRPLRRDENNNGWRPAKKDELLHNDVHHASDAELPVGGEN